MFRSKHGKNVFVVVLEREEDVALEDRAAFEGVRSVQKEAEVVVSVKLVVALLFEESRRRQRLGAFLAFCAVKKSGFFGGRSFRHQRVFA